MSGAGGGQQEVPAQAAPAPNVVAQSAEAQQNQPAPEPEAPPAARQGGSGYLAPSGARHIPHYHDLHEDYVPVSRPILRELSTFGWLQEGAGAAGMFFFSGAFWLFITMIFEHFDELKKYVPWLLLCIICMLFGAVLVWVGYRHFQLKQARIQDIFRENPEPPR
jgi:hypothetical protein